MPRMSPFDRVAEITAALMKAPSTRVDLLNYLGQPPSSGGSCMNVQKALDALQRAGVVYICEFRRTRDGRHAQPVYAAQPSVFKYADARCPWPTITKGKVRFLIVKEGA